MEEDDNEEDAENVEYSESESAINQIEEEAEEITEEPPITVLPTIAPYYPLKAIKYICMDTSSDCEGF